VLKEQPDKNIQIPSSPRLVQSLPLDGCSMSSATWSTRSWSAPSCASSTMPDRWRGRGANGRVHRGGSCTIRRARPWCPDEPGWQRWAPNGLHLRRHSASGRHGDHRLIQAGYRTTDLHTISLKVGRPRYASQRHSQHSPASMSVLSPW
jgi:hypothetical protein